MRWDPVITHLECLGRAVTCTQLYPKIYQIKQVEMILKLLDSCATYIPSVTDKEKFTCRALIRSQTFSWENTRTGRVGSCPDSGMKILSCERARPPKAPLDSLGERDTVKLCSRHLSAGSSGRTARGTGVDGPGYHKPLAAFIFELVLIAVYPHPVKYLSQLLGVL